MWFYIIKMLKDKKIKWLLSRAGINVFLLMLYLSVMLDDVKRLISNLSIFMQCFVLNKGRKLVRNMFSTLISITHISLS